MRQPRFAMGEKVSFLTMFVSKQNKDFTRNLKVTGIVSGVFYDPANMSSERPYYNYTVTCDRENFYNIKEQDLESVEG